MSDLPPPSSMPDLPPPAAPEVAASTPGPLPPVVAAESTSHPSLSDGSFSGVADPHAESPEDATLGLVMYLLPLLGLSTLTGSLGLPLGAAVAPLLLWLWKKDHSHYVDVTGKEVINFNLCAVVCFAALRVLHYIGSFIWLGPLFTGIIFLLWVAWVANTLLSAYRANGGNFYRFPLSYRLIK